MIRVFSIWMLVVVALAAAAEAQPAAGGSGSGSAAPSAPAPVPPPPSAAATDARSACTTAMNADPTFAVEIIKVASDKAKPMSNNSFVDELCRDADTVKTHEDAVYHVEKNEKHVIYAYAAMWLVAAGFLLFLWRRQQALKLEIGHLKRELETAASDTGTKETKS